MGDFDYDINSLILDYNNELKSNDPNIKKLLYVGIGIVEIFSKWVDIAYSIKQASDLIESLKNNGLNLDTKNVDLQFIKNSYSEFTRFYNISKKSFIEVLDKIFLKNLDNQNIDVIKIFELGLDKKIIYLKIDEIDPYGLKDYYQIVCNRIDKLIEAKDTFIRLNSELIIKPFITEEQKNVFDYLSENWIYKRHSRYAYIFKYMTETLSHGIDFTTYNKFIILKYGKKVQRNNADKDSHYKQLRELMKEHNN